MQMMTLYFWNLLRSGSKTDEKEEVNGIERTGPKALTHV